MLLTGLLISNKLGRIIKKLSKTGEISNYEPIFRPCGVKKIILVSILQIIKYSSQVKRVPD